MRLQLIEGWKDFWKMYSVWAMVLLGAAPELFNAAIAAGLFTDQQAPAALAYAMKLIAFAGIAARIVKQKAVAAAK